MQRGRYTASSGRLRPKHDHARIMAGSFSLPADEHPVCLCLECRLRQWWALADWLLTMCVIAGSLTGRLDAWLAALFFVGYAKLRSYHLQSGDHAGCDRPRHDQGGDCPRGDRQRATIVLAVISDLAVIGDDHEITFDFHAAVRSTSAAARPDPGGTCQAV
jgi:hypothetical protein